MGFGADLLKNIVTRA